MNQNEQMCKALNKLKSEERIRTFAEAQYWLNQYKLFAEQALTVEPSQLLSLTHRQVEFLRFLDGAGTFEGVSFGEEHPEFVGRYWWRRFIEDVFGEAIQATQTKKLVRLTEKELLKAYTTAENQKLVWQVDRERYLRHAKIVMDAVERKNGGAA